MWFKIPKKSFSDGLVELEGEDDVMRMAEMGVKYGCIHVFVEVDSKGKSKIVQEGCASAAAADEVISARDEEELEQMDSYETEEKDEDYDEAISKRISYLWSTIGTETGLTYVHVCK